MAWTIEWSDTARKQLRKLDRQVAQQLVDYVESKAAPDPRAVGKALTAQFASLWRTRLGDHRGIVSIEDAVFQGGALEKRERDFLELPPARALAAGGLPW